MRRFHRDVGTLAVYRARSNFFEFCRQRKRSLPHFWDIGIGNRCIEFYRIEDVQLMMKFMNLSDLPIRAPFFFLFFFLSFSQNSITNLFTEFVSSASLAWKCLCARKVSIEKKKEKKRGSFLCDAYAFRVLLIKRWINPSYLFFSSSSFTIISGVT